MLHGFRETSRVILLILVCGVALARGMTAGVRYRHDHVTIFPVAGASYEATGITIDGDLTEWRREAFIRMTLGLDAQSLPYTAYIAFAYDNDGLYYALRYVTQYPLVNKNDPRLTPDLGWRGCSVQFRMVTDPTVKQPNVWYLWNSEKVAHITMWLDQKHDLPGLDIRFRMDYAVPTTLWGERVRLKCRIVPRGCTMEGFVAWKDLRMATPPQPGQRYLFTIQPHWSDENGQEDKTLYDCVCGEDANPPFSNLSLWGSAYFAKPTELSTLFATQQAEERRIFAPPPPAPPKAVAAIKGVTPVSGVLTLGIFKSGGQLVRTLLARAPRQAGPVAEAWDGLDQDGKPATPGSYQIRLLAHAGLTATPAVHLGQPGWDDGLGTPLGVAGNATGGLFLLWHAGRGDMLLAVDAEGKRLWSAAMPADLYPAQPTAVAATNDTVYVGYDNAPSEIAENATGGVLAFDAVTGVRRDWPEMRGAVPLASWKRERVNATVHDNLGERLSEGNYSALDLRANLVGLATAPGRVYSALYLDDKIIALDAATGKMLATYPVKRPSGVACDTAGTRLYVVSEDKLLVVDPRTPEKPGVVLVAGLANPYAATVGPDGTIWVSIRGGEMRVRGFTRDGAPLREIGKAGGRPWIGAYTADGMLEPAGISVDARGRLWVAEDDPSPTRVSVWDTGTGQFVREFFGTASVASCATPDPLTPEDLYLGCVRWHVDYRAGRAYPAATIYRAAYDAMLLPGPDADGAFSLAAYQGKRFAFDGRGGVYAVGDDRFTPYTYIGPPTPGLTVTPRDGVTPDKLLVTWMALRDPAANKQQTGVSGSAPPLTAGFFPGAGFLQDRKLFYPRALSSTGLAIYPTPEDASPVLPTFSPMSSFTDWRDMALSPQINDGANYVLAGFPAASRRDDLRQGVYKFSSAGKILWRYGRTSYTPAADTPCLSGDLCGAQRFAGVMPIDKLPGREVVAVTCSRGYYALLSGDGLFIDQVAGAFGARNGALFCNPMTGKVYLSAGGGHVLEINGWDTLAFREVGVAHISPEQYQSLLVGASKRPALPARRPIHIASASPKLDGTLRGWDPVLTERSGEDAAQQVECSLAMDELNLYVLASVAEPAPWQNAGTDWRAPLSTGDAVVLHLSGPFAQDGGPGQMMTIVLYPDRTGAGCRATGYWVETPARLPPAPLTFRSPRGMQHFARVAQLAGLQARCTVGTDSYLLEAAIPWTALGIAPWAVGQHLRGDLTIAYHDTAGTQTTGAQSLFTPRRQFITDALDLLQDHPDAGGEMIVGE